MSNTRTSRTAKKDWAPAFIAALAGTGNVKEACAAVGVGRSTVYDRRLRDTEFAIAWVEAEDQSHDTLEREAWRRAAEGVEEPVFQGGKQVGAIRKYSDTLLIFLLKARRPEKYRDNHRVEHTGADGGPIMVEDRSASLDDVARLLRDAGALNNP